MSAATPFEAHHVERRGGFLLPVPPRDAFAWFSPEGERAWAPGWRPEYLHPRDGSLQSGLVFRTEAGGEPTLWLLLRYDRAKWEAEYVRMVPDSRVGTVAVVCRPAEGNSTEVSVAYRLTALCDAGNRRLAEFTDEAFAAMMHEWKAAICACLRPASR